jgi:hypothetical protein
MFDIFASISNGLMNAITKEFFSRRIHYIIENKKKIIAVVLNKKEPRDYYELSVNHPNTPFTYNGNEFVPHL